MADEKADDLVRNQSSFYRASIGEGIPRALTEELRCLAEKATRRDFYTKYSEIRFVYEMLTTSGWRDKVLECVDAWVEV